MKQIWVFLFLCWSTIIVAKPGFEETPLLRTAYKAIFDLRLDLATQILNESKNIDPDNYLVYHIENYIDFVTLFVSEDESQYEILLKNKEKRLSKIKKGDSSSPYYLFCQAEINLQWAIVSGKFDRKIRFGLDASNAYSLLKKNNELFPDFIHNKKTLSAIHALGESLPPVLQYLFSVKGSIKLGISEIQEVISYSNEHDYIFKEESIAIYALISYHLSNEKEKAWEILSTSDLDPKESPIAAFLLANIGQKTGRNEEVIKILLEKPNSTDRYPFYYLDYLLGKSKLNRLDNDANTPILFFLKHFKGKHYIKEAYQKLAWYELVINNNFPSYKRYMLLCQIKGNEFIESDKQANKEANGNFVPDLHLLTARLYFDGGYMHKSYQMLIKNSYNYEENSSNQLEYFYRLARVTDALKNYSDAITYYSKAINLGYDQPEYYACKSALQLGVILENEKQYNQAKNFYEKCLTINPVEYRNDIHASAKAGLERLKER